MKIFDKNFWEMIYANFFAILGGLIAGVILAFFVDEIFFVPGILIILPGFMAMRGSISGTFSARITAGLFLKVIDPDRKDEKIIKGNFKGSFILGLIVSLVLGIVAFIFNYVFSGIFSPVIIFIPFFAGIISNLILAPFTLFMTIYLFKKGKDPNNIVGPIITTAGDFTSVISLFIIILLLKP